MEERLRIPFAVTSVAKKVAKMFDTVLKLCSSQA